MKRKTIDVIKLIEEVNRLNKESKCSPDQRMGWNCFLEHILHETNNYNGFGYYNQEEVPTNQKPGIIWGVNNQGVRDNTLNTYPDESRRFYYIK